jgi:hypothetical protein
MRTLGINLHRTVAWLFETHSFFMANDLIK